MIALWTREDVKEKYDDLYHEREEELFVELLESAAKGESRAVADFIDAFWERDFDTRIIKALFAARATHPECGKLLSDMAEAIVEYKMDNETEAIHAAVDDIFTNPYERD